MLRGPGGVDPDDDPRGVEGRSGQRGPCLVLAVGADAVYVNIPDLDGLAAEAEDAAASGFTLKACIHPSQVPVVRAAFQPDEAQVAWARRVLDAVRASAGHQDSGALKVDGQMIDAPLIRQAEAILASVR